MPLFVKLSLSFRLKKKLLALERLIYPRYCSVCNKLDQQHVGICINCMDNLPWCESTCATCGLPLVSNDSNLICGRCQKNPPAYDSISAAFWYQAPIDHMILQYKYFNRWHIADTLVNLLLERFAFKEGTVVIPIPSHSGRVRSRGFNVVFELLRVLHRKHLIKVDFNYLLRIKNTSSQTGKTEQQRRHNVKNAFQVNSVATYKQVVLFDDVVTTGTTVTEASRCLKKHGVEKVYVWALARTKLAANSY